MTQGGIPHHVRNLTRSQTKLRRPLIRRNFGARDGMHQEEFGVIVLSQPAGASSIARRSTPDRACPPAPWPSPSPAAGFGKHRNHEWDHDQVRAVVPGIVVDSLGGVSWITTRWTLRFWNLSVRYDCAASVSACQMAAVSITGTTPPYQSGMTAEGISSTCNGLTSDLYLIAIASTNEAVAVQISDMSTGNR
jgi:hypothetical protein